MPVPYPIAPELVQQHEAIRGVTGSQKTSLILEPFIEELIRKRQQAENDDPPHNEKEDA